ncbi:hypothetical protein [Acidovorax sp.]|uniref:hypothetical protein n=1 Tax=Acidovorax sp. TaxID=1872122 RepID=UPI00391F5C5C
MDLTSKSLEFRVASQVSLEPARSGDIKGLQITLDSEPLDRPYLTVVELINDGLRPISSSEFEGPAEIRLSVGTKVVRAELVSAYPKSLEARVAITEKGIAVAPLLLNPEDKLTISILSSGGQPLFSPSARIAGVTEIKLDVSQGKIPAWKLSGLALLAAFLLFVASDITNKGFFTGKPVVLRKRAAIFVSVVTGITGVSMFVIFLNNVGVQGWWQNVLAAIVLLIFTGLVATLLNLRPKA